MSGKYTTTRRRFFKNSAVATSGAVLGMHSGSAVNPQSASAANESLALIRRPATIYIVSFSTLPPREPDSLHKTLKRMETCIEQAAELHSDLVAFPEVCNQLKAADPWQLNRLMVPRSSSSKRIINFFILDLFSI